MPLHAKEFFDELALPFPSGTVVGDAYYATPAGDPPLRLRIEFAQITDRQYDGLLVAVVHAERGVVEARRLRFAEHGTFARRDAAQGIADGRGVIRDWHKSGPAPWAGGEFAGLRKAIEDFAQICCPALFTPRRQAEPATWANRWHDQFWASDTTMLARFHEATQAVLGLAEGGTYDDRPISESLHNARFYVMDMLGLPLDQGILAEAAAVTQLTGRRLGPDTAEALSQISALPLDRQRALVQAVSRRHAAAPAARRSSPPHAVPAATAVPVGTRTR